MRPVDLHIEELVVLGADPRERHRIAAAVERSLAERFAGGAQVMPEAASHRDDVAVPPVPHSALATPERLGTAVGDRIATAIHATAQVEAKP